MNKEPKKNNLDISCGFKDTDHFANDICAYCQKPFSRFWGEKNYELKYNHKHYSFCCYTCLSKARQRIHQQEEEKHNYKATTLKGRLQEYVNAGLSNEKIAMELNTYGGKVKKLLDEYGIKRK